jgi:hypothetical protein
MKEIQGINTNGMFHKMNQPSEFGNSAHIDSRYILLLAFRSLA